MSRKNLHHVLHVVSISLMFETIFVLLCVPVSIYYHEAVTMQLLGSVFVMGALSVFSFLFTRKKIREFSLKDNYIAVVLTWVLISIFGAIPYMITGAIPLFKDAFFESVSGFTTTGSSILRDIEIVPKALLFWRAETHWLGGMGIIVLVIALMPYFNIGGQQMIMAEGSFFSTEKIKSRTIDVAKRMWLIYVALTLMEIVALKISGMGYFDSVCHSFATIATGGFSTKNKSLIDALPSTQYIVILFMILSGMNFTLHYLFVHGRFKKVFKNEEMRTYLLIIGIVSILIGIVLHKTFNVSWEKGMRDALFQVSSVITATGFVSANYQIWPGIAKALVLFVMLIGACAGSTGGGIKVARYVLMFKSIRLYVRKIINPNWIQIARFNGENIGSDFLPSIFGFAFIYYTTIIVGTFVMLGTGLDIPTASSSVITTLGGVGPGFNAVGPIENFADISTFGKFYLSFNMIIGRLEILSALVLVLPAFWRK
ncbi:MAG: TrkH family potassium uptake protein [Prolixibacteraceae bacterium]